MAVDGLGSLGVNHPFVSSIVKVGDFYCLNSKLKIVIAENVISAGTDGTVELLF